MTNGLDIARQPSTTVKSDQNQALPLQYYGAVRYRYRAAAICHSKNPIKKSTDATVSLCRTVQCYCNSSLLFTDSVLRLPVWLPDWLVLSAGPCTIPCVPYHHRIDASFSPPPRAPHLPRRVSGSLTGTCWLTASERRPERGRERVAIKGGELKTPSRIKKKTHEKAAASLRTSSLMGNYSFRDYTNKFGRPFHTLHSAVDHSRIYPLDRLDLTRINWKWYIFVQILFMSYWSTSISNQWASIATQSGRHPLRPLPTRPFRTTILSGSGTSKYIM